MSKYHFNTLSEYLNGWQNNNKYFDMLKLMAQLSKLFSDSQIPYLDYRLAENLFCRYYSATNEARACTAYDAILSNIGIGIKTFILKNTEANNSLEKIAEFNKLSKELKSLSGIDLARMIGVYRNERIQTANITHNVSERLYHIVGRTNGLLRIFNTPYETIDIDNITIDKDNDTSCIFHDDKNEYTYNKSKSVLLKRFYAPKTYKDIEIEIIQEPITLLENLFAEKDEIIEATPKIVRGIDYVILPLYSTKNNIHYIPEKSGLNQFNASGRRRDRYEMYIRIPIFIHKNYPDFFPKRNEPFSLLLPDGNKLSAKICQDGEKALMSNPNKALGEWLIHKILRKKEHELVTINDLYRYGFDSVYIQDLHTIDDNGMKEYRITLCESINGYEDFKIETEK